MNLKFWNKASDKKTPPKKKSKTREWVDAAVFAIIAATLIRTFLIEAFTIPTPSMEETLMVGDFLFVSKVNYGPRLPMTPIAFPFVHQELPFTHIKSYADNPHFDYHRIWGFAKIKNDDIVVFNYPARPGEPDDPRPVDKKTHYIKRCVAIPGDTLMVRNGDVYINGKMEPFPERGQRLYHINSTVLKSWSEEEKSNLGLTKMDLYIDPRDYSEKIMLTQAAAKDLSGYPNVQSVDRVITNYQEPNIFCFDQYHQWNKDSLGPIYLPRKGDKIKITPQNLSVYVRAITAYEKNTVDVRDGKVFINKKCSEHGEFEALFFGDADLYVKIAPYNKPGTIPLQFATDVHEGCPLDCGL